MFTTRREPHLKATPLQPIDVNHESRLKHPNASVHTIRQYRQALNVHRTPVFSWHQRLIQWLKF